MIPDSARFEQWLRGLPSFEQARVRELRPVEGGASNLTCRVAIEGGPLPALALRLQRDEGIFAPYDVLREAEVVRRLAASPVPVPGVIGVEPDPAALGAPFAVLEWIEAPHMGIAGPEASFEAYTAMVIRIHSLDWRALGLDFLGVPESPAEAILAELDRVAARMTRFASEQEPLLSEALDVLRTRVPADGRLALCQGDINVFNYLFRAGEVVGVVDWEQAHIGDPRSDVGQLLALSHLKGAPFGPAPAMPFVLACEAASGAPLRGMEYFRARWLFELGVIHHCWRAFNDSEPWYTLDRLSELLESALSELD